MLPRRVLVDCHTRASVCHCCWAAGRYRLSTQTVSRLANRQTAGELLFVKHAQHRSSQRRMLPASAAPSHQRLRCCWRAVCLPDDSSPLGHHICGP